MKEWKDYQIITDENDRVFGAYSVDSYGNRIRHSVYIRNRRKPGDRNRHPQYYDCVGEYTRKEAYNRFRSGRLIFK